MTDGGHRHATDRVDGALVAECPNVDDQDDDHLQLRVDYFDADPQEADEFVAEFREVWVSCGECGTDLQWVASQEPTETLTDGGVAVAGPCPLDACDGTVVSEEDRPHCDTCGHGWPP